MTGFFPLPTLSKSIGCGPEEGGGLGGVGVDDVVVAALSFLRLQNCVLLDDPSDHLTVGIKPPPAVLHVLVMVPFLVDPSTLDIVTLSPTFNLSLACPGVDADEEAAALVSEGLPDWVCD